MLDVTATTIITTVVAALAGSALGYVVGVFKTKRKKSLAESNGVCALLASKILDDHERYCVKNEHITMERHQNIVDICESFQTLRGIDHTYEHYINDLCSKKPFQVIE